MRSELATLTNGPWSQTTLPWALQRQHMQHMRSVRLDSLRGKTHYVWQKKHDFEEEIGDENAPPLPNAQAPKGQDPVKPKAEAAKPKDSEQKPTEFKAALADAKPKPKLPRPAKDESKPKLPKPQKAVAAPKAIEQPKIAGPFSDGSKLQVQLETGWVDCSDTEMMQIGAQLAGDSKKFAVHARGAMYIVDFTDPDALTQTHAVSKKTRPMRIVKP